MTATLTRKPATRDDAGWKRGDIFQAGGARWIIRLIRDDGHVELESSNTLHRIWWTTTVRALPTPPKAR